MIEKRTFAGPSAFAGCMQTIRVAHLTDMHVGRVTPMKVQRAAVEATNREKPDVVALTGDFVCHSQVYLDDLTEIVRGFDAPVVAVLGNHDHWSGGAEVRRALERAGAAVLSNAFTTLTVRGQKLQLVGLDDAYTGHADRDRATRGLDADVPSVGLSHIGEEADGLWARGVPFVLSGHTHAGQITVAKLHERALGKIAGHKYMHGLYGSRNGTRELPLGGAVYVGAGIGSSFIPFRVGERSRREVALFELGVAPGTFDEHHAEQRALAGRKPTARTMMKRHALVARNSEKRARRASRRSDA